MVECKKCGTEFDEKHPKHRGGYINVCGDCGGRKDVTRHMAVIDAVGKTDVRFGLVRNPTKAEVAFIKRQGRCAPNMCHTSLGVGSYSEKTFGE